jgi:hypothetical protein
MNFPAIQFNSKPLSGCGTDKDRHRQTWKVVDIQGVSGGIVNILGDGS